MPKSAGPINLRAFKYTLKIEEEVNPADLIVCHCGAGTLLDSLRAGKKAIGVINSTLMDNHQKELAGELHESQYIALALDPEELRKSVL